MQLLFGNLRNQKKKNSSLTLPCLRLWQFVEKKTVVVAHFVIFANNSFTDAIDFFTNLKKTMQFQCFARHDEGPIRELCRTKNDRCEWTNTEESVNAQDPAASEFVTEVHLWKTYNCQIGKVLHENTGFTELHRRGAWPNWTTDKWGALSCFQQHFKYIHYGFIYRPIVCWFLYDPFTQNTVFVFSFFLSFVSSAFFFFVQFVFCNNMIFTFLFKLT